MKEAKNEWEIDKRCLESFDFHNKTGDAMAHAIIDLLKKHCIGLLHSRGQCFDNGSNKANHIKGVQAKIKEKKPFSPCPAHSLILIGLHVTKGNTVVGVLFNSSAVLTSYTSSIV